MKWFKKFGFILCVLASALVIGTNVAGYVNDKKAEEETPSTEACQVVESIG